MSTAIENGSLRSTQGILTRLDIEIITGLYAAISTKKKKLEFCEYLKIELIKIGWVPIKEKRGNPPGTGRAGILLRTLKGVITTCRQLLR